MIDLGIGYNQAKKDSSIAPVPANMYSFVVEEITLGESQAGRPKMTWWLRIENNPEFEGRRLPYNVSLPWVDPATGIHTTAGIGFLVDIIEAIGASWGEDGTLPDVETFYGMRGFMRVGQKPRKGEPETIDNTIKFPKKGK